jgi:hypothetical protein
MPAGLPSRDAPREPLLFVVAALLSQAVYL